MLPFGGSIRLDSKLFITFSSRCEGDDMQIVCWLDMTNFCCLRV